jgi:fatty acid synthase subunit alpha
MATRTPKAKYEAKDDSVSHARVVLCHAKNGKEIYYQFEDEPEAAAAETPVNDNPAPSASVPTPSAAPVAAPAPSGTIEDTPIRAGDVLGVIITQKPTKKVEEVPHQGARWWEVHPPERDIGRPSDGVYVRARER